MNFMLYPHRENEYKTTLICLLQKNHEFLYLSESLIWSQFYVRYRLYSE